MYNFKSNIDEKILEDFNWFLYKINQRECINLKFIDEEYLPVNRYGIEEPGLGLNVEYFHPSITLDNRMRFIAECISAADISDFNIFCNTLITHLYGARQITKILTQDIDTRTCYVDFDRIAEDDADYIQQIKNNIDYAIKYKIPIWDRTALHTSIQTAARNFCRKKYNDSNRLFHPIDVSIWVASFKKNGIFEKVLSTDSIETSYNIFRELDGVGSYYGYHAAASTSVLPITQYHHDQRFVMPGPGACHLIKTLFRDIPNKLVPDGVYFLRENGDEIGLTENVHFHEKTWNIQSKGKNVFSEAQDSLKYYGTEVLCCQFGIYLEIRNDVKKSLRRQIPPQPKLIFNKPKTLLC